MNANVTKEQVPDLLRGYNKKPFHILHASTIEGTMWWYTKEPNYGDDEDFWGVAGLLYDISPELYPEEYHAKAPELLKLAGANDELIHVVRYHDYGICSDAEPVYEMKKALLASDELAGLIDAAARTRPSESMVGMGVPNSKKKSKDKRFVAGCSCDVIVGEAEKLGQTLGELVEKTILAMHSYEERIQDGMDNL